MRGGADLKRGDTGDELTPGGWLVGPVLLGSVGCLRGPGSGWQGHCFLAPPPPCHLAVKPCNLACPQIKQPTVADLQMGLPFPLRRGQRASNLILLAEGP